MQNSTNGRNTNADSFFRSDPSMSLEQGYNYARGAGRTNWNTEAAGSTGTAGNMDTKDLSILQDEMHSEALLYKKCSVYADYFTDPQLRSVASAAAEHHRKHFESLNGYLNSHN